MQNEKIVRMADPDRGRRRRRWLIALLVVAALVAGTVYTMNRAGLVVVRAAPAAPAAAPPPGLSADPDPAAPKPRVDYARLEQRIGLLMREPDMVGLAVGTIEDGRVRFVKGFGEALAGSGQPVTPDTVFRWGSVSKGVAAALVTKLAERGKLSLEAPIRSVGTTLRLPGDAGQVTIADVLSHRVGIVHNAWDDRLEGGESPRLIRGQFATLPNYCPPATCYAYQNIAFDTATELIEQATGRSYAENARDTLFRPLGMTGASTTRLGLQRAASWAQPHRLGRRPTVVNDIYYGVPAAGGVNSSIRDLVRWMRAQLGDAPKVLSPAVLDAMHHARVPTPPKGRRTGMDKALKDAQYGLGWRSFDYQGHHLVGHRGTVEGYGSLILFDPKVKTGIVMLWNSNWGRPSRLQLEFLDMYYGLPPTDWLDLKDGRSATGVVAP